jgi:hypothetical protein
MEDSDGRNGGRGGGAAHSLCTLDKGKCDQASFDLVVDATCLLRNHGQGRRPGTRVLHLYRSTSIT